MIQEIDIFLNLVYFLNVLLVQRHQRIHGAVEILGRQGSHAVKLLHNLKHSSRRVEDNLVSDVFELIAFSVADLLVFAGNAQAGQLYDPSRKREQNDYLENLDQGMRICNETTVVCRDGLDQSDHGCFRHKQDHIQKHGTDDIEPEVNQSSLLRILLTCERGKQCSGACSDVTSQNNIECDGQRQQILVCKQKDNADRHGRALNDGCQKQSDQSRHEGIFQRAQKIYHCRDISHG